VEQIPGEVVCDAVAIFVGRRLERSHCSVDKTNCVVNVFTCMILAVQVSNLDEQQIQCGLRAVLETAKNQAQHQRSSLTFSWSTQVFFAASIPEIRVHIGLEGHLQERHVLLDMWLIDPSVEALVAECCCRSRLQWAHAVVAMGNTMTLDRGVLFANVDDRSQFG